MHMKETSMHINNLSMAHKDHVGFARKIFLVEAVSIAHLMNKRANNHLRSRITVPNARHIEASLLWRQNVGHCSGASSVDSKYRQEGAIRIYLAKDASDAIWSDAWNADSCMVRDKACLERLCKRRSQDRYGLILFYHRSMRKTL